MLRVRVLGELCVEADGRPAALPRGLATQLLAYLAVHPGPHPRARIAAALWPAASVDVALHRLRTTVWDLRTASPELMPLLIEGDGRELALRPAVPVDLLEARALLDAGAVEAALTLLEPGLAEQLDGEWAEPVRRDLQAWRLQGLERLVHEAGEVPVALAYARRRLALAPLSEAAHADVIRLLVASGDRAEALAAYEHLRETLERELGVGPSAASRRLLAEISDDADAPGAEAPPVRGGTTTRPRVPVAATPLVGRAEELAELDAVARDNRLVSVVGPAGVGKSRLALAVLERLAERGVPVAFAELATTQRGEVCDYVVAGALDVHAGPGRPIRDAILDRLELRPGVLVLDNCEHLLAPVRELVTDVLRSTRATTVLTTSREALATSGERVVRLAPLPVPAADDEDLIRASPAVQLLAAVVRRQGWDAPSASGGMKDLARIARQLDGLPLALELAAARIPSVGVTALAERLGRGLDVLSARPAVVEGRAAGRGNRHDGLVGALEVSVDLLAPEERTLLGLVSLLPGPFPLTAVQELVRAAGPATDCVVGMARLVEASLLQSHPGDPWSYSSLETVRTFGRTLLDDETARAARDGLVRWAVTFARDVKLRQHADEIAAHAEVSRFLPLVRAALHLARDRGDVRAEREIVTGVEGWSTWREQPEAWSWITHLAAREPADHPDPEVLRMGALAAFRLGDVPRMRAFTERCAAAEPTGVSATQARTMVALAEERWTDVHRLAQCTRPDRVVAGYFAAESLVHLGRPDEGLAVARRARRDAERLGAPSVRALTMLAEGRALGVAPPPLCDHGPEVLLAARDLADEHGLAELAACLEKERGCQELRRGRPGRAVDPLTRACLHWLGTGNRLPLTGALRALAEALDATGRADVASGLRDALRADDLTPARVAAMVRGTTVSAVP